MVKVMVSFRAVKSKVRDDPVTYGKFGDDPAVKAKSEMTGPVKAWSDMTRSVKNKVGDDLAS